MNFNLTLVGQIITFGIFIWLFHRYLYNPINTALANRQQRVQEGIEAGERGRRELEHAEKRAKEILREAREQANEILTAAERRADEIREEATEEARQEAERIQAAAHDQIDQEFSRARQELKKQVAELAIEGAEKILEREVDYDAHHELLERVVARL